MPKSKSAEKITEKGIPQPADELDKIIEIPVDDGLELIPGGEEEDAELEDEEAVLDEDEIDPFKDKWEE